MIRWFVTVALTLGFTCLSAAQAPGEGPPLLRTPVVSRSLIAFSYAGDIWTVPREGGVATRLTTGTGAERNPTFSPDGALVAFSGEYDGNVDVYVVPAAGGVPRRLTAHPENDVPVGWTPDGRRVLFRSQRDNYQPVYRLFTAPVEGGFPEPLPLPTAFEGSYSPDGTRIAYVPVFHWQAAWKRYRGGLTKPIWIAELSDSSVEKLPRESSNDFNPMWVGQTIYFLSDRSGPVTLFAYDTASEKITQIVRNSGFDMKSASAGPGAIVYEQFGSLHLLDLASGSEKTVSVRVTGDLPEVRARLRAVEPDRILNAALSPSGARAVFEARGEILTVPAEKGRDPQPDANTRRGRPRSILVSGRNPHRLLLGRVRGVHAQPARPERAPSGPENRPRGAPILLLLAPVVP